MFLSTWSPAASTQLSQAAILLQFIYKGSEVLQLRAGFRDHQLLPTSPFGWNDATEWGWSYFGRDPDLSEKMTC